MKKQIRNFLIALGAIGLVLGVLVTCAPPAAPAPPTSPSGGAAATPGANFRINDLRMTNGGSKCNASPVTSFNVGQPIFVNWAEHEQRDMPVSLYVVNTTNGYTYPALSHIPTPSTAIPNDRCEEYQLVLNPTPGAGIYTTKFDIDYRVTPVTWTIR